MLHGEGAHGRGAAQDRQRCSAQGGRQRDTSSSCGTSIITVASHQSLVLDRQSLSLQSVIAIVSRPAGSQGLAGFFVYHPRACSFRLSDRLPRTSGFPCMS